MAEIAPGAGSPPSTDTRAQALVAAYARAGYARVRPPILQPADPFLDLSGEDIRRRMYLTTDPRGREWCLRPDFTIAVSCQYLASAQAGREASFCYLGPIFRFQEDGTAEIVQAGLESFGRADTAAADAEMLSRGLEAAALYGVDRPAIRVGDVGLFAALIEALDLPPIWKRRLVKDFTRAARLDRDLDLLAMETGRTRPDYTGLLDALAGADRGAAQALVTDLLSIAGINAVGGRSVDEIAERFLEQATLGAAHALPGEIRALIQDFLAVGGEPRRCAADLRALAAGPGLDIAAALDLFETRADLLAARGIDLARVEFSTAFSIGLDYYTGFEFRLHDPAGHAEGALVAGGRYDKLLTRLGSKQPIPAVGLGIWIERLAALGGRA